MIAETEVVEDIVLQVKELSPAQRLRLIQRITETLISSLARPSHSLQFGKYKSDKMSTLEDFAIAEWRPTDEELDGK